MFTGYTIDEINNSSLRECLNYIDVLIDGRYEDSLRIVDCIKGSSNQNVLLFSSKVKEEEIYLDQEIEIFENDGILGVTGFPVLDRKFLKSFGVNLK